MKQQMINEITSVRGIAALSIVIHHFSISLFPAVNQQLQSTTAYLGKSYLWVDMFFLLSGFILTKTYSRKLASQSTNYRTFMLARFARIYPLHFFILVLFVLLEFSKYTTTGSGFTGANGLVDLLRNIFLLQGVQLDPFVTSWNHPSWSISIEWLAYLIFPLIVWLLWRTSTWQHWSLVAFSLLVISAVSYISGLHLDVTGILGFIRCVSEMLIGSVIAIRLANNEPLANEVGLSRITPWFFRFSVVLLFLSIHLALPDVFVVGLMAILLGLIGSHNLLSKQSGTMRVMNHAIPVYIGTISYSIYLSHILSFKLIKYLLTLTGFWQVEYSLGYTILSLIFTLAITVGIAAILYHYVEAPSHRYLKSRFLLGSKSAQPVRD